MHPEEGADVAHRLWNVALGVLLPVGAQVGPRHETHGLHGERIWVRRDVFHEHQYRRLAGAPSDPGTPDAVPLPLRAADCYSPAAVTPLCRSISENPCGRANPLDISHHQEKKRIAFQ
jgi:hypothetical protein